MERKSERYVLEFAKKVGKRSHPKEGQEEIADRFSREKDDEEADEAEAENAEKLILKLLGRTFYGYHVVGICIFRCF